MEKDPKSIGYKLMKIDENLFKCWMSHASLFKKNVSIIRFEDWLFFKEQRNKIANSLGFKNNDCTNTISFHGEG